LQDALAAAKANGNRLGNPKGGSQNRAAAKVRDEALRPEIEACIKRGVVTSPGIAVDLDHRGITTSPASHGMRSKSIASGIDSASDPDQGGGLQIAT
jgi:hypothetical protein